MIMSNTFWDNFGTGFAGFGTGLAATSVSVALIYLAVGYVAYKAISSPKVTRFLS